MRSGYYDAPYLPIYRATPLPPPPQPAPKPPPKPTPAQLRERSEVAYYAQRGARLEL